MNSTLELPETEFLQHFLANVPHMMWFLGAGTSRSAGLPTATDIIWDLKRRYYCLHENQDLQTHDINNKAIKKKIQDYMDSQGFPKLWSPEEYSYYFELTFGEDYEAQQNYIQEALSNDKISLNIGHRALAALQDMGKAKVIFTTNFDDVIEAAYAAVTGKNLSAFHLEGSYAALTALNNDNYPLYAKVHGDFRYHSIKNLSEDLLENDKEIQNCLLAAATRYGMVISGYSGRDENVMSMFREALDQNNAFPHGLFWTVPRISNTEEKIKEFINYAGGKGVSASLVETGTFDEMLSKIWRQVNDKPQELDEKVRTARVARVYIPLPEPGKHYPILRTNALPVVTPPTSCGQVELNESLTFSVLKKRIFEKSPNAVLTYTDRVLFWGDKKEIVKVIPEHSITSITPFEFDNPVQEIASSTFLKSFFEQALAESLCQRKPLFLRRNKKTFHAVVREDAKTVQPFIRLRNVIGETSLTGSVPGLPDLTWAESISIRLEERGGNLLIMLHPDIWITPLSRRQEARDFMYKRRIKRYNNKSSRILDAWIGILIGDVGTGAVVKVSCFPNATYSPVFEIGTRTNYSAGGVHGR